MEVLFGSLITTNLTGPGKQVDTRILILVFLPYRTNRVRTQSTDGDLDHTDSDRSGSRISESQSLVT